MISGHIISPMTGRVGTGVSAQYNSRSASDSANRYVMTSNRESSAFKKEARNLDS